MDMESSFLPLMSWMKMKMLMSQLGKGSLRIVYLIVHLYGNPFETSISLLDFENDIKFFENAKVDFTDDI